MRSLRSRLVIGSALIALVPLAIAIYLLSQRVERLVRTEAGDRLENALGGLQAELEASRGEMAQKLGILARDVTLKRLYLLGPEGSRDLSQYLEEKRFLLGLGFLRISSPTGVLVADADAATADSLARPSALAMSATAPIPYQGESAGLLSGGLRLDRGFLQGLKQTRGVDLVLLDSGAHPVASTLADSATEAGAADRSLSRYQAEGRPYLGRSFPLDLGGDSHASVIGLVSSAAADRTIRGLQLTAALLGLLGVVIAVILGWMWSSQISRPVERLAAFSQRLSQGDWEEPLTLRSVRELETLVAALERMRGDLRRYREQLVIGERHAAWSQMARKVAHEVKNPLTPIAVSIADLKRSFDQRRPDFPQILDQAVRTVSDEVQSLKHLLNEFSEFARFPTPVFAPCDPTALIGDLEALYAGDVASGRLTFVRSSPPPRVSADADQLRQALVNLIKNGFEAANGDGRVTVTLAPVDGGVEIAVSDDGPGLSPEQRSHLFVPGFTTKASGSGLGLTIVERIVHDHRGTIAVEAAPSGGTTFRIHLPSQSKGPRS